MIIPGNLTMKQTLITALCMGMALPALAQTLPDHATSIVEQLKLTEVRWHPGDKQADMDAILAGVPVEIDFHRNGQLDEIEADHGMVPLSALAPLLPTSLAAQTSLTADALVEKIEFDTEIDMNGRLASGAEFEAEFSRSGALIELDVKS
jgi:hypothetical protein